MVKSTLSLQERFWSKVRRVDDSHSCWLWIGHTNNWGYGTFRVRAQQVKAHRLAYELAFGPFDPALKVLHHCDTPPCCRPDHLFLGTDADNTADMIAKGRRRPDYKGSEHWKAKLTEEQVIELRALYATGQYDQIDLADRFGLYWKHVGKIVRGNNWSHVLTGQRAIARNRGATHHEAKLSEEQVREIRSLYASGLSQYRIAMRFSVSQTLISKIVLRKLWKSL